MSGSKATCVSGAQAGPVAAMRSAVRLRTRKTVPYLSHSRAVAIVPNATRSLDQRSSGDEQHFDRRRGLDDDHKLTPFFEPLVRCFILGVVFGGLFEASYVLQQLAAFSTETSNVWARMTSCPPQFVQDHIIAFAVWLVLYLAETWGIASEHRGAASQLGPYARFISSLPRRLLPFSLELVKMAWLNSPYWSQRSEAGSAGATLLMPPPTGEASITPSAAPSKPQVKAPRVRSSAPTTPFVEDRAARPGLRPGEWSPDSLGGKTAQEEVARRSYLTDMYYCIAAVPDGGLKVGELHEARIMGQAVAYWKEASGKLNAISNVCTHRGSKLSNGWVDEVNGKSCVRCPYHAWAFSGDGKVQHIPVQPDGRYPHRALQQSFDLQESSGLLWLYWGNRKMPEAERAPIPALDDLAEQVHDTITVSKLCDAPHHIVFHELSSRAAIAAAAERLLGTTIPASSLKPDGTPTRGLFSVIQAYVVAPPGTKPQKGLTRFTFDKQEEEVSVRVTVSLPSTVSLEVQRGAQVFKLDLHTMPAEYEKAVVTATLRRNCLNFPGARILFKERVVNVVERARALAEGQPAAHDVLPRISAAAVKAPGALLRAFYGMRHEFVSLGYGQPAEVSKHQYRVDM